jgi:hypothetical protein
VSLEWGSLSFVSTIEKLLERKSSGFGLENRDYGPRWPRVTPLYPQKLALTSPTNDGLSVDIVRLRTKASKLLLSLRTPANRQYVCTLRAIGIHEQKELQIYSNGFIMISYDTLLMYKVWLSTRGTVKIFWNTLAFLRNVIYCLVFSGNIRISVTYSIPLLMFSRHNAVRFMRGSHS